MNRLTHNRPTEVDSDTENIAEEITTLLNQLNNCKEKIENTGDLCPISPYKRQQRKDSDKTF
ncbi:hypothetical protein RhiirC2_776919 [Rhizophagus irregularis]|uniref:Uncharacterized protein n=1 Tax=Rhizophagus irregularis TaxID=588596 RepID=A0A2N1NFL4_9GLOM|nr:hypothetical protein RhiirC2_776919 [Rhizophagus irregularis]